MDEPRMNSDQPFKKTPAPDVEQQEFDRENQLDPGKCANCGAAPEPGHMVPLCTACRNKLSKYPVPMFIIVSLIVVLGLTVAAFLKFPESLKAGVAFSKGEKTEKAGKYKEAYVSYYEAFKTYRNSTPLIARMAITCCKSKDYETASALINMIAGRDVSKTLAAEINAAIAEIDAYDAAVKAVGAKEKKAASKKPSKKEKGGAR